MPRSTVRLRTTEIGVHLEHVRIARSLAEHIFRDAHGILRQAVRGTLPLPDEATVQTRIDLANGISLSWRVPVNHMPWKQLHDEILRSVNMLEAQDARRPEEQRNQDAELLRWRAALCAAKVFINVTPELGLNEEYLNQARAWWSMHDKSPQRRGKRRAKANKLKGENQRLRRELAALQRQLKQR